MGNFNLGSVFAFVLPSPLTDNLDDTTDESDAIGATVYTVYGADKGEMQVTLFLTKPNETYRDIVQSPEYLHSVNALWGGRAPVIHKERASNAFGTSVEVTSGRYEEYGLSFDIDSSWNIHDKCCDSFHAFADTTFSIPVDEARTTKDHLRVLVICKLKEMPVKVGYFHHKATISDPLDTTLVKVGVKPYQCGGVKVGQ
jgi:hypothetical protein